MEKRTPHGSVSRSCPNSLLSVSLTPAVSGRDVEVSEVLFPAEAICMQGEVSSRLSSWQSTCFIYCGGALVPPCQGFFPVIDIYEAICQARTLALDTVRL